MHWKFRLKQKKHNRMNWLREVMDQTVFILTNMLGFLHDSFFIG